MRRIALLVFAFVVAVRAAHGQQPYRLPGKSVALLIGTDTYAAREWPRLSSPVFDANTLARTLAGDFAFDTAVVRNATKDEIIRAIVNHGKRAAGADDWSLVFIAAHGYFDDDRAQGYLAFRDSKPRTDDVSRSSYLSLTELRAIVEGFQAGHVLLVIDACYAGTIDPDIRTGTDRADRVSGASSREVASSLERRAQYRSRMYLTSGGKEYVPDGRPGAHSPFAGALLSVLRGASNDGQPITFSQIVAHMAAAGIEPIPRHNTFRGHEPGGDFLLVPRSFATAWAPPATRRTDEAAAPDRGARRPAPTREAAVPERSAPLPSALATPLMVRVQTTDDGRDRRTPQSIANALLPHVAAALTARGFTHVVQVDNPSAGALCPVNAGASDCAEVTIRLTRNIANNRQTVTVGLSATRRPSGQSLGAGSGNAGPYTLDVPADRVATRAADQALEPFIEQLTASLARRGS
jgi:uncharacterized caspase-like protein